MVTATSVEATHTVASPRLTKEVAHLGGCPADRVERYDQTRPDGQVMRTTRCIDCGSQRVDPSGPLHAAKGEH